MQASDYPVSFPFGATTDPYTPANVHNGDDRAMPLKTPVVVNGMLIGYSGSTGNSTGAHLHVSRYLNGRYLRPGNPFALPAPAVFDTGYNASSGYFVRLRAADGSTYAYCHLSPNIPLRPGQPVAVAPGRGGGENQEPMITDTDNEYARWRLLGYHTRGRELSRQEFQNAAVGKTWLRAVEILQDCPEANAAQHAQEVGQVAVKDNWEGQIRAGQTLAKTLDGQVQELKIIADNLKADDEQDKQLIQTQVMKIAALTDELQVSQAKVTTVTVQNAPPTKKPAHNWFVTLLAKVAAMTSKPKV